MQRVIWASSAAAYGYTPTNNAPKLLTEDDKMEPVSMYGASKLFNEHFAEFYARKYGLDHICLRLSSVYGYGRAQRGSANRHDVYSSIVELPNADQEVNMPPGDHCLAWSYVEDCANAFYCAYKAEQPTHRIFNFGGEIRPIADAAEYVRTLIPNARIKMGDRPVNIIPYLNTDRIRDVLGFVPEYSMEKGIKDYVGKTSAL